LPVISADLIAGFRALPDLAGMASGVMDELAIVGGIPASVRTPIDPKARLVGRALAVLSVKASAGVAENVGGGVCGLGEIEAHNRAEPGDVLVLQGVDQASNIGGMSTGVGHRQGQIGAIVEGAVPRGQ
jgi:4-hydroxy-4-methyl-2-oxoglutarate aldolase